MPFTFGKRILFSALIMGGGMLTGGPAQAQATRTWVSGVGDDVNPCSRTAPCKTFAGAISKTAAGGEINCLDPGGFGAVTITKSITISCPYTEGGALAGGNGIVVNDSATLTPNTAVVVLRGLDIFGVNPPANGVRFVSGAALHIEDCTIRRFNAANSAGVSFAPSGAAQLSITNTVVSQNGSGATGGGIVIAPTGAGGIARVMLRNVSVINNANFGLRADTTTGTNPAGLSVVVESSEFVGNAQGVSANSGAVLFQGMITNSTIANNSGTGLAASGFSTTWRVSNTTITGNATGIAASGGSVINSYGNNRLDSNPTSTGLSNGTFTAIIPER